MPSMDQDDIYSLKRFLLIQEGIFKTVRKELRLGKKHTHWMWFVFPQYKGLGVSQMAHNYAIQSMDEARAYLNHPVLGGRLIECVGLAIACGKNADEIFGYPDNLKFRSSMTLFNEARNSEIIFHEALIHLCDGNKDQLTLDLLAG